MQDQGKVLFNPASCTRCFWENTRIPLPLAFRDRLMLKQGGLTHGLWAKAFFGSIFSNRQLLESALRLQRQSSASTDSIGGHASYFWIWLCPHMLWAGCSPFATASTFNCDNKCGRPASGLRRWRTGATELNREASQEALVEHLSKRGEQWREGKQVKAGWLLMTLLKR